MPGDRYEPMPPLTALPGRLWELAGARGRRLAVMGAVAAAVLLAVGIPLLQAGKHRRERAERQRSARTVAAERARLVADQAPRTARASGAGLPALQAAVLADVRGRVRAGTIAPPVPRTVECGPSAQFPVATRQAARRGARFVRCIAYTTRSERSGIGIELVGWVQPASGRMAWCKTNPSAGEKFGGSALAQVDLVRGCFGPRD